MKNTIVPVLKKVYGVCFGQVRWGVRSEFAKQKVLQIEHEKSGEVLVAVSLLLPLHRFAYSSDCTHT